MRKYLLLIIILLIHYSSFAHERVSNLIIPVNYFINHIKQLTKLNNNLSKYHQASVIGTSGIGKTQLVRMYAYENKNKYNLIWFFDCNLDLNEGFLKLAQQLNKTAKDNISEDKALVKKEVITYLTHQKQWLLVFDNLKINNNKKVQDLIDWEHNGNVIFCSQDSEILPYTIEMTTFNNSEAISLASNILESSDQKLAIFLAEAFNGYPILIVQGAQLLNRVKGIDLDSYKNNIYHSTDKIRLNISLVIKELTITASKLLSKIALINNQRFSKELLGFITDEPNTLDADIYQLSKFALISNIDSSEYNPVFEMHDVIVEHVLEINGTKSNKKYLDNIIEKLIISTPNNILKSHIFRHARTIHENLEVILENAEKYNSEVHKVMLLNVALLLDYINAFDYYSTEKKLNWFKKVEQEGKFKLWLMNNEEKHAYGQYIALIGGYYKRKYADDKTALQYLAKAKEILDDIKGYETTKCNVYYNLAFSNISLGRVYEARKYIQLIEQLFTDSLVHSSDIVLLHLAKVRLFFVQGDYPETIEQADKTIKAFTNNGIHFHDLLLTNTYLLKAETLNILGRYQEAYTQTQQLYNMHKSVKKESHEVFGRIYTQIAKSELGQGEVKKALDHVNKAIAIFLADDLRNPKDLNVFSDPELAASYVVQGDILFAQNELIQAIESYRLAQGIYFHLYKDNSKNVAHVSYLYMQGAKAACKKKDSYYYECFGKPQIEEFGLEHPNTITMFEYCQNYDMKLLYQED